jgi:hypothetical protein
MADEAKHMMQRLRAYGDVANIIAAWTALLMFWALWLGVFVHNMAPRLGYFAHGALIGNDLPCGRPECDFYDFWRAGLTERVSPDALRALVPPLRPGVLFALPGGYHEGFPYPPMVLLPADLVSHLPFEAGFLAWTMVWALLAVWLLRWAGLSWVVVMLTLLSPAALWNTMLGQLGVIGGAVLVAGLLKGAERPTGAGVMLGLLACKPQTGILVPAALLGQRSWRGMYGFAAMCALLVGMTLLVFGPSVWLGYLGHGQVGAAELLDAGFAPRTAQASGVSVFWALRSLHAGISLAEAGQVGVSVLVMAVVAWLWARGGMARQDKVALTVLLSLLATPYGYTDDMVAGSAMLALLAERRGWRIGLIDVAFWLWPVFCPTVSLLTGVLFTPLVVALAAWRVWREAALRQAGAVLPATATGA